MKTLSIKFYAFPILAFLIIAGFPFSALSAFPPQTQMTHPHSPSPSSIKEERMKLIHLELIELDARLKEAKNEFDLIKNDKSIASTYQLREIKIEKAKKIYDRVSTITYAKIYALQQEKKFLNRRHWEVSEYKSLTKTLKNRTQILTELTDARIQNRKEKTEKLEKGLSAIDQTLHKIMLDRPFGPQKG